MIDRNGSFSPKENEQGRNNGSVGGSLLTEASFIARAKEERDETKEVLSNLSEISFVLKTTTLSTKVTNFRSGITDPIIDHMMMVDNRDTEISTRRHKETVLYLSGIRREIERSSEKNTGAITSSIRDTYYSLTKSLSSAISTIITPIIKTVGVGLFGSKKERSVVEAVDEQTQFLRSGRILDNSTIFSRFFRRGLVGAALAGVASTAGIGLGAAQSAEDKRGAGQDLNLREKLVTQMGIHIGWFKNFDKRDTKKTFDRNNPQVQQTSVLERIQLGVESFLEFYREVSEINMNDIGKMHESIRVQTSVLQTAIQSSSFKIANQLESANDESESLMYHVARAVGDDISYFSSRQNNIMSDVKDEMVKANNPMPTAYETRSLYIQNQQYDALQQANELARETQEANKPKENAGGGLVGMAISLGKVVFNSKTAAAIGALGKKYLIAPVMGAIKSGGSWLMKNGFRLLVRVPFAKIFAVVGITGILYKYLARPMIDWFDNTFDTDIGGAIDRFGTMISDKFYGMLDWIRQKMASVPLIGRFFEKSDGVPKVPEDQQKKESGGIFSSIGNFASDTYESAKNAGSDIVGWYGDKWGEMADVTGSKLTSVAESLSSRLDELGEQATTLFQNGMDRMSGYDPTALSSMRQQALSSGQIAQDALGSMINPLVSQSPSISSDMQRAALESRDSMMTQWNEMKRQRSEVEAQNRQMLEMLSAIAGNTEQGVRATMESGKQAANAMKNRDNHTVSEDF